MGDDPNLNVFVLDLRPNGLINKGIKFDVPEESTMVVRLLTGNNAHIQYGLLGDESQASRTLYLLKMQLISIWKCLQLSGGVF